MPGLPIIWVLVGLFSGAIITGAVMWFVLKPKTEQTYLDLQNEVEEKRAAVERETAVILQSAQQEAKQIRMEAEKVTERRYQDLARTEERVDARAEKLDQQYVFGRK